jgi:bacillithiol biosynthesis deacetylase BshB1
MKVDILAIGVHPDDVELGAGATLYKHIIAGYTVGVIDLTAGELGTRGTAAIRAQEAAAAAAIMGFAFRVNMHMADGFFTNDKEHQLELIEQIRKYKPEVVLANALTDRHPDHGRAAKLIADACFYSGLAKIETKQLDAWRPKAVYHYIQDYYQKPDFIVDVSEVWEWKMKAIAAFSSQFYNPDSKEAITPIATKAFLQSIESRARDYGRLIGAEYGEGFCSARTLGVDDLFVLK